MSPNQELINGLITQSLTKAKFKSLKDNLKIDDEFLARLLRMQRKREDMDNDILTFLSDTIVQYIVEGKLNLEWLEHELDCAEINKFHKSLLRKLSGSIIPKTKKLTRFLGYYAM